MATFEAERVVAAPRDRVWEVVSDVARLAAHAPNLSASEVVEGSGEGMVGRRYTLEVDTSDYPYPMRQMRGTWAVEDDPGGTRIHLRYEFEPKYGLAGRALAVLMRPVFALTCRKMLDSYEQALGLRSQPAA